MQNDNNGCIPGKKLIRGSCGVLERSLKKINMAPMSVAVQVPEYGEKMAAHSNVSKIICLKTTIE